MMHELELPFVAGSVASEAAARQMPAERVRGDRDRIVEFLRQWGAATDETMQTMLEMEGSTQRPRRVELARDGVIVPDGHGVTRSGRKAVRWRLV